MGLRYGLLAAITLILASALLWDRLHPPEENRLDPREEPAREDVAVVVLGGTPVPLPPAPPPGASLPGVMLPPGDDGDTAPASGGPRPEGTYVVEPGDTLGSISRRTLGTARRAAEIARVNGMTIDTPLKVGRELRLPPARPDPSAPPGGASLPPSGPAGAGGSGAGGSGAAGRGPAGPGAGPGPAPAPPRPASTARTHTVGKGDSLFALARRFYGDGSKYRSIAEANGLDPDAPLRVGTEIRIP